MLDVRRLRILREVARQGSITAAAEALSYTASAVSQQVAVLEREAGVALVERRSRGVALTEAGRLLVEHADGFLARVEAAEAALDDLTGLRRGRLRVSSFATASATVLPRAVDRFRERHPAIELRVLQAEPGHAVRELRDGRVDLALTLNLPAAPAEGIEVTHLFDDPFRLALPRRHPLAGRTDLRLEELAAETWVAVPADQPGGESLLEACARAGFRPRIAFESEDYAAIRELVAAGAGIALLPDLATGAPQEGVVLRDLGPDRPRRALQAATRSAGARPPAAGAMLGVLLELGRPPAAAAPRPPPQPAATSPPSR